MYQMYAYSKFYDATDIWLLYPMNDAMRGHEDIIYMSNDKTGIDTRVNIAFIDLSNQNIEEEILDLFHRVTYTKVIGD
jgi:5-methylcytosine-specific restriction enzyme subunit McrC